MQRRPYGATSHPSIDDANLDVLVCAVREDTLTDQKTELTYPSMYKVLLLNDDYTPMDFVIFILERYFAKSPDEARHIMLEVHNRGSGVCGIFTYEIAETKIGQVMDLAQQNQHPLQCTLEKA
ncbi:ATP-dependent Clp protease adapter ClpS [Bombella sp. ESL0385]|uniref:ATP-dependent Clp protease adapter ClpS n=1 Tax=Bombella sp. ESL0385 TaxID=2676446 RepID=UPI0012D93696|nr:ATP-dependent Clp protease adapter ClpS [Bombella sp. ESL0385]MUG90833.1 ATP-dependent Clp protease adapter ClpS [Bombella sp. ESL0385]